MGHAPICQVHHSSWRSRRTGRCIAYAFSVYNLNFPRLFLPPFRLVFYFDQLLSLSSTSTSRAFFIRRPFVYDPFLYIPFLTFISVTPPSDETWHASAAAIRTLTTPQTRPTYMLHE